MADRVYCDGAGSESSATQASDEGETQEGRTTHITATDSTGGWSGREYPDYKTQWKQLLTPLCEVVIFVDKLHRDSKAVNP